MAILYSAKHGNQHKDALAEMTHLLELSTMIHVVKNRIKCILLKERLRDISLVPIT